MKAVDQGFQQTYPNPYPFIIMTLAIYNNNNNDFLG